MLWALVKDRQAYENMLHYVGLAEMGISRDTRLRALQILKGDVKQIFQFAYKTMSDRWDKLNDVISSSLNRFSIQEISPRFCNFFEQIRGPSPVTAYAFEGRSQKLQISPSGSKNPRPQRKLV
ncbi:hypothetical protein CASFOL_038059 [Castilleja foliolosa]|uniref:Alliinase C-terminal domain-containing protein n=1 Tax=Castilleja foliolosa TaxID=1961234 RepID=A0ABD3BJX3_9LAMI